MNNPVRLKTIAHESANNPAAQEDVPVKFPRDDRETEVEKGATKKPYT